MKENRKEIKMVFGIVFVAVFLVFSVLHQVRDPHSAFRGYGNTGVDYAFFIFIGLSLSIAVFVVGIGLALGLGKALPKTWVHTDTVEIVKIQGQVTTGGTFFLGSGIVDGELYYFYYAKMGDGRYRSGKIPAGEAIIYEEDRNDAYIDFYAKKLKPAGLQFWIGINLEPESCEIHVPNGSIKSEFSF